MKKIFTITMIMIMSLMVYNAIAQEMPPGEAKAVRPSKVKVDTNFDGEIDRIEQYDANGMIVKVEMDSSGDGKINEWIYYKDGQPIKSERDTNADGKIDAWIEY